VVEAVEEGEALVEELLGEAAGGGAVLVLGQGGVGKEEERREQAHDDCLGADGGI